MEPIAIVGMACRFPGAQNLEQYWQLLCDGVDAIERVHADRWDADRFYDPDQKRPGKMTTKFGSFLPDVDKFDLHFFGISPREAAPMDPQQRLLLEVAWEALEHGGLVPERLCGTKTGVFVGVMNKDFGHMQMADLESIDPYTGPGGHLSITANRLSYLLDLRGPSMAIDTACSSSLVALHLACQSLQVGDSAPVAIAAGVNLVLSPAGHVFFSKAGVMAPDGRSKTFDASADGFVRGDGVGAVVLKTLAQAQADGDTVYAVIRGSAVNQDGRTNGLMAPNRFSQEAVLREAYQRAGISPGDVGYVEAHGTGTLLGDPIEATTLGVVLAEGRPPGNKCLIGSVKTNLGHLESAAGMAGVIKVALMLKHGLIPPNLHFHTPNPYIPFDRLPLRVPVSLEPWPEGPGPRLAGVSGFGFGGTNAHIVLEGAPSPSVVADPNPSEQAVCLLPLSGKSPEALRALAQAYVTKFANTQAAVSLSALSRTASRRRTHHDHRLTVVADSVQTLRERLDAFSRQEPDPDVSSGRRIASRPVKPTFVFSGQGSQWWGMGRQLLQEEHAFRLVVERCSALIAPLTGWSLIDELLADEGRSRLKETSVAQPALFAVQVGLVELLRSWGVTPHSVIGHSVGEIAAAYTAGALTLEQAIQVVYHRSRLMQRATGLGRMVAVSLPADTVEPVLSGHADRLSLAAINSPDAVVIAGTDEALQAVLPTLKQLGGEPQFLPVAYAFHSPQMESFRAELEEALEALRPSTAALPIWSTASGAQAEGTGFTARYWADQMRLPVRFADAVQGCAREGSNAFVEIGPHPVLSGYIGQCLRVEKKEGAVLALMRRHTSTSVSIRRAVGALFSQGYPVNWEAMYPSGEWLELPTYPWQRERCWFEPSSSSRQPAWEWPQGAHHDTRRQHPVLGPSMPLAHPPGSRVRAGAISTRLVPWVNDHRIQGSIVVPGTLFFELALATAQEVLGPGPLTLRDLRTSRALVLTETEDRQVQVIATPQDGGLFCSIYSAPAAGPDEQPAWVLHATGLVVTGDASKTESVSSPEILARCPDLVTAESYYAALPTKGLEYGPTFRGISKLWRGTSEALGQIRVPEGLKADWSAYRLHPAVVDACGHLLLATDDTASDGSVYMPIGIKEVRVFDALSPAMWSHVIRLADDPARGNILRGDVRVFDEAGHLILEVHGLEFQRMATGSPLPSVERPSEWVYELQWEPKPASEWAPAAEPPGVWLILADHRGVGAELASSLESKGDSCVLLYPNGTDKPADPHALTVHASLSEDLSRIIQACRPKGIVHLWNLDIHVPDGAGAEVVEQAVVSGCENSLHLIQAVTHLALPRPPRIWFVTSGAQGVGRTAELAIGQAPLWGFVRSAAEEHPELWGGVIDLDPAETTNGSARLLHTELITRDGEDQVAFLGSDRLVPRLVRSAAPAEAPVSFRADGAYLITGGLGGLGLAVAQDMVAHGACRLILLGRTPLPPRSEWAAILPNNRLGEQITAIRTMEASGASIHLAAVDVSNERELDGFLRTYRLEGWPPIRGVVHAAGHAEGQALLAMDSTALTRVLRPKVMGAWLLHTKLAEEPLDFFLLFSSASALLNSPGLASYAAANAFLDGLAHYRRSRNTPALSINWGPWAEVGLAARSTQGRRQTFGALGLIEQADGLDLFRRQLRRHAPQVAVMRSDWAVWRRITTSPPPMLSHLIADQPELAISPDSGRAIGESLQALPTAERHEQVTAYLRDQVASVLRLPADRLDVHRSVLDLGLDSLMLTELKHHVEVDLKVTLPLVTLLQGPTILQLGAHLNSLVATTQESLVAASVQVNDRLEAEQLLARVASMTDSEVDELLAKLLEQEDGN